MAIRFDFLPVSGDSILVTTEDCTMLIDGGTSDPFSKRNNPRNKIKPDKIDIVVVTHIDRDHIGGIIELLKKEHYLKGIKQIWFNEPPFNPNLFKIKNNTDKDSCGDGISLQELIAKHSHIKLIKNIKLDRKSELKVNLQQVTSSIDIDLLSPEEKTLNKLYNKWDIEIYEKSNEEEYNARQKNSSLVEDSIKKINFKELSGSKHKSQKLPNRSSIAFTLKYNKKNYLFLGDADIGIIYKSLKIKYSRDNPLVANFIKLSHHGSKGNISDKFLSLVKSNNYIICRNSHSSLPNIETIAKIITKGRYNKNIPLRFYVTKKLNNSLQQITENDKKEYNIEIILIKRNDCFYEEDFNAS